MNAAVMLTARPLATAYASTVPPPSQSANGVHFIGGSAGGTGGTGGTLGGVVLGGPPVVVGGPVVMVVVPGVSVVVGVGHGHVGVLVGLVRGASVGGIVIGHFRMRIGHENEEPKKDVPSNVVPSLETGVENWLTMNPVVA